MGSTLEENNFENKFTVEKVTSILQISRPHYQQEQLNNELHYCKPKQKACRKFFPKSANCTPAQCIKSIFPIFAWLPSYSWKKDFVCDLISGFTVAVMHIPQGMGYALLAQVPPIVGIYMAFFPVLIYFIFGTSRHNSMGTFALVNIMVGKIVLTYSNLDAGPNLNSTDVNIESILHPSYSPIEVGTAVCFLVGLIQLGMYAFRLGIITSLLSDTLISGFTTAAAIHVLTSQIKDILGISIKKNTGYFEVINTFIEIFKNISSTNFVALALSATVMAILITNNEIIKGQIAKVCSFPVPIELMLVLAGTLVSKYMNLSSYSIKTLGNIPTGFPEFSAPKIDLLSVVIVDSIPIAVVSYTVTISMALIFAQKLNYEVDSNQELLAMGAGNVFASFFSCLPFSASLSRSTIQQTVGGRTQIASIVSCGLLAIVLLWIGPFFEPLPRCVLAGIIVVSLKGMLFQVTQLYTFWKLSYVDAFVWLITFLSVVIVAIDIGLLIGIILSLCCIFIRGLKPYTCLLGHVPGTDLYLDVKRYKAAKEIPNIKIFHYCGSLNFASRTIFKNEVCSKLKLDLADEIKRSFKKETEHFKENGIGVQQYLILDFSALSYIDPSSVSSLKSLINDFRKIKITTYIAGSSCPVYEVMQKCDLHSSCDVEFKLFPTIHDAIHYVLDRSTKSIDIL